MTRLIAVCFALLLLFTPGVVLAQASAGVFFDEAGTDRTSNPPAFTTTNAFYVVANSLADGQIAGFEFDLDIAPEIITFGAPTIVPPGSPINVGDGPNEFIVGLGNCASCVGPTVLVQFTYGVFVSNVSDLLICMIAASPSSFGPPTPGYLTCNSALETFGQLPAPCLGYPDGCAVVYDTCIVSTSSDSWGNVKARY